MVKQRTEGEGSGTEPLYLKGLLERVAAREALLETLSPQLRAQEDLTVARVRQCPSGRPVPVGLLTEAAQALAGGSQVAPRPWLTDLQVERLRRAENRYTRHCTQRPDGAPAAPAAILVDLVEHAPGGIGYPLAWGIAQLDLLSKRMRREHRRTNTRRLGRRRAERRSERDLAHAEAFYRRPSAPQIEAAVDHLANGLAGRRRVGEKTAGWRALEDELQASGELPTAVELEDAKRREANGARPSAVENRGSRWRQFNWPEPDVGAFAELADRLRGIGVGVSGEELRCKVRDRVLLAGGDRGALERLKRPDPGLRYTPESYDPAAVQLTGRDLERSHVWAWRRHGSRRSRIAPGTQFGAPPTS